MQHKSLLSMQLEGLKPADPVFPDISPSIEGQKTDLDYSSSVVTRPLGRERAHSNSDSPGRVEPDNVRQRYYQALHVTSPLPVPPSPNRIARPSVAQSAPLAIPKHESDFIRDQRNVNPHFWMSQSVMAEPVKFIPPHKLRLEREVEDEIEALRPQRRDNVRI